MDDSRVIGNRGVRLIGDRLLDYLRLGQCECEEDSEVECDWCYSHEKLEDRDD